MVWEESLLWRFLNHTAPPWRVLELLEVARRQLWVAPGRNPIAARRARGTLGTNPIEGGCLHHDHRFDIAIARDSNEPCTAGRAAHPA